MACVSCDQLTNKYKCCSCAAPYCSLNCYKLHKDSMKCTELATTKEMAKSQKQQLDNELADEPTLYAPFSTDDTVPPPELQKLASSDALRELLYNPHLRKLLTQIDTSRNIQLAMTAAMQEPLFIEFADACLQVLEPMSDSERAELARCGQI